MTSFMRLRPSPNEEARILQEERERRRKLRIVQVREQSKRNAAKIRVAVRDERQRVLNDLALQLMTRHELERNEKLKELEESYQKNLQHIGEAHRDAASFNPKIEELALKKEQNARTAAKRHKKALQLLHEQQDRKFEEENHRIFTRQAALEFEKLRSNEVASRPPPLPDPVMILDVPKVPVKPVKLSYENAYASTHYHIVGSNFVVEEANSEELEDAFKAAEEEQERIDTVLKEKKVLAVEQQEKARVRHHSALKKERLKQDYNDLLHDLSDLQRKDIKRRQEAVAKIPKQIFVPPYQRAEQRLDMQHLVEREFEDMYMKATDYGRDLSLALDPHPVPEVPESADGLDLTDIDTELIDDEEPLPQDATVYADQSHAEGQPPAGEVTRQSKEQEAGLWKLLNRIKSQRDTWITKGKQKPMPEKAIQKEEIVKEKTPKAKPALSVSEDISSDDDKMSVSSQPLKKMLTPPMKMDRPGTSKSGASEVSSLTQYTLPPSDSEPVSRGEQQGPEMRPDISQAIPDLRQVGSQDEMLMHPMERAADIRKDKDFDHSSMSAFLADRRHQQEQFELQNQQIQTEISQRQADLIAQNEVLERKIRQIEEKKKVLEEAYVRQLEEPEVPSEPPHIRARQYVESVSQFQGAQEPIGLHSEGRSTVMSHSEGHPSLSTAALSQVDDSAGASAQRALYDLPISATASAVQTDDSGTIQPGRTVPMDRVKAYQAAALLRRQRDLSAIGAAQLKDKTDQLLSRHAELHRNLKHRGHASGLLPGAESTATDTSVTSMSSGPPDSFGRVQVDQPEIRAPVTHRSDSTERTQSITDLMSQYLPQPEMHAPVIHEVKPVERTHSMANLLQQYLPAGVPVPAGHLSAAVSGQPLTHAAEYVSKPYGVTQPEYSHIGQVPSALPTQTVLDRVQSFGYGPPEQFVQQPTHPGQASVISGSSYGTASLQQYNLPSQSMGYTDPSFGPTSQQEAHIDTPPHYGATSDRMSLKEQSLHSRMSEYGQSTPGSSSLQEQTLTSSGEDAESPKVAAQPGRPTTTEFPPVSADSSRSDLSQVDASSDRETKLRSLLSKVLQQHENLNQEYQEQQMHILTERDRLIQEQHQQHSPIGGIATEYTEDSQVARDAELRELDDLQKILNGKFETLQLDEDDSLPQELLQETIQRSRPPVKQYAADLTGLRYHELSTIAEIDTPKSERIVPQRYRPHGSAPFVTSSDMGNLGVEDTDVLRQAMPTVTTLVDQYGRMVTPSSSQVSQQTSTQFQPSVSEKAQEMASVSEMLSSASYQGLSPHLQRPYPGLATAEMSQDTQFASELYQNRGSEQHQSIPAVDDFGSVSGSSYQSIQRYGQPVTSSLEGRVASDVHQRQRAAVAVSQDTPDSQMVQNLADIKYRHSDMRHQREVARDYMSHVSHLSSLPLTAEQIAVGLQRSLHQDVGKVDTRSQVPQQATIQGIYQPGEIGIQGALRQSTVIQQAPLNVEEPGRLSSVGTIEQTTDAYSPRVAYQGEVPSSSAMQQPATMYRAPSIMSGPLQEQTGQRLSTDISHEVTFKSYEAQLRRERDSQKTLYDAGLEIQPGSSGSLVDGSLSEVNYYMPEINEASGRTSMAIKGASNVFKTPEIVQSAQPVQVTAVDAASFHDARQTAHQQFMADAAKLSRVIKQGSLVVDQAAEPYSDAAESVEPGITYAGPQGLATATPSSLAMHTSAQALLQTQASHQPREAISEVKRQSLFAFKAPVQVSDVQEEQTTSRYSGDGVGYYSAAEVPQTLMPTQRVAMDQPVYGAPIQFGQLARHRTQDGSTVPAHQSAQASRQPLPSDLQGLQSVSGMPYRTATTVDQRSLDAEALYAMEDDSYQSPDRTTQERGFIPPSGMSKLPQVPYQGSVTVDSQQEHMVMPVPGTAAPSTSSLSRIGASQTGVASGSQAQLQPPPGTLHLASVRDAQKQKEGQLTDINEDFDMHSLRVTLQKSQLEKRVRHDPRKQHLVQTDRRRRPSLETIGEIDAQDSNVSQVMPSAALQEGPMFGRAVTQGTAQSYLTPRQMHQAQVGSLDRVSAGYAVDVSTRDETAYASEGTSNQQAYEVGALGTVTFGSTPAIYKQARTDFERGQQQGSAVDMKLPDVDFKSPLSMTQQPLQSLHTPPTASDLQAVQPETAHQARTIHATGPEQIQVVQTDGFTAMQEDSSMILDSSKTWADILTADQANISRQQYQAAVIQDTGIAEESEIAHLREQRAYQLHSPTFADVHEEPEKFTRRSSTPAKVRPAVEHRTAAVGQQEGAMIRRPSTDQRVIGTEDGVFQRLDLDLSANTTAASDVGMQERTSAASGMLRSSEETRSSRTTSRESDSHVSAARSSDEDSLTQHTLEVTSTSTSHVSPQQSTSEEDETSKPPDDITLRTRMSVPSGLLRPHCAAKLETSGVQESDLTQYADASSLPQMSMDSSKDYSEQHLSASLSNIVQDHLSRLQEAGTNLPHGVQSYLSHLSRSLSEGKMSEAQLSSLLQNLEGMTSLHLSALGGSSTPRSLAQYSYNSDMKQSLSSLTPISQASLIQGSMFAMSPGSAHSLTQHSMTSLTPNSVTHSTTLHSVTPLGTTLSQGRLSHYSLPSPILEPNETSQFSNTNVTPFQKSNISKTVSFASPLSRGSLTQHSLPRDSPVQHSLTSSVTKHSLSQHHLSHTLSGELSTIPSLSSESPTPSSSLPRGSLSQHAGGTSLPIDLSSIHSPHGSLARSSPIQQSVVSSVPQDSLTRHSFPAASISAGQYSQSSVTESKNGESLSSGSPSQHSVKSSQGSMLSQHYDGTMSSKDPSGFTYGEVSQEQSLPKDSLMQYSLGTTLSRGFLSPHMPGSAAVQPSLSQHLKEASLLIHSPTQHSLGTVSSTSERSLATPSSVFSLTQHSVDPSFPRDVSELSQKSSLSRHSPTQHSSRSLSGVSSIHHSQSSLPKTSQYSCDLTAHGSHGSPRQHSIQSDLQGVTQGTSLSSGSITNQLTQYMSQAQQVVDPQVSGEEMSMGSSLSGGSLHRTPGSHLSQHSESTASFGSIAQQVLERLEQMSLTPSFEKSGNPGLRGYGKHEALKQHTLSPSLTQGLEGSSLIQGHSSGSSNSSGSLSQHSMIGDESKEDGVLVQRSPSLSPITSQSNLSGQSGKSGQFSKVAMQVLLSEHSRASSPGSLTSGSNSPSFDRGATDRSLMHYNLSDVTGKSLTQRTLPDVTGKSLTQYEMSDVSGQSASDGRTNATGGSLTQYTINDETGKSLTQYEASGITGRSLTQYSLPDLTYKSISQEELDYIVAKSLPQYNMSDASSPSLAQYNADATGQSLTQYDRSGASGTSALPQNLSDITSVSSLQNVQRGPGDTLSQHSASNITGRSLIQHPGASVSQQNRSGVSVSQQNMTGASISQRNVTGASLSQRNMTGASISQRNTTGASISQRNMTGASISQRNLTGASVSQQNMTGASISQQNMTGASVSQRNMTGASLSQQNMTGASISQRNMTGASASQFGMSYASPYSLVQSDISDSSGMTLHQTDGGLSLTQHQLGRTSSSSLPQHNVADPSYNRSLQSTLGVSESGHARPSQSNDNVSGDLTQYEGLDASESKSNQSSLEQFSGGLFSKYYLGMASSESSPQQHQHGHVREMPEAQVTPERSLTRNPLAQESGRSGSLLSQHQFESSSIVQSAENSHRGYSHGSEGLSDSGSSPNWARIQTPISQLVEQYIGPSSSAERTTGPTNSSPLSRVQRTSTSDSPASSSPNISNVSAESNLTERIQSSMNKYKQMIEESRQARASKVAEGRPVPRAAIPEVDDTEEMGILEEPNLTFASDVSDMSRQGSPFKRRSATSPAVARGERVPQESPGGSHSSQSLLSFEKHELSLLSDADQSGSAGATNSSSRDSESATTEYTAPSTPCRGTESEDESKVYIVETPASKGSHQRGPSLQEAFERKRPDFIKSSKERKAQVKEKSATQPSAQSKMKSTLSSWKRSRALNAGGGRSDAAVRSVSPSAVTKNASDRKKGERLMRDRTKRLYLGLEEVKTKMLDDERKKQYAMNREKAQEYKLRHLQKVRKKWDKKD